MSNDTNPDKRQIIGINNNSFSNNRILPHNAHYIFVHMYNRLYITG